MAFLFGGNRRQKQPTDIARSIKDLLRKSWNEPSNPRASYLYLPEYDVCVVDAMIAGGRGAGKTNGTDEAYCPGHSRFVPIACLLSTFQE